MGNVGLKIQIKSRCALFASSTMFKGGLRSQVKFIFMDSGPSSS